MYCAWRIPVHLRCTQCSILFHLMDICFMACICLWQISQIQTRLFKVVGPGLVSTLPAFVSSSTSHPACPKNGKSGPHCWGREDSTQFAQQLVSAVTAPPLVNCVVWSHDVFVLWLIGVCEWVGGSLFVMGSCVICAWCCCCVLCGCMNGASPVRIVLSLFYLFAIQMNPVCGYI